MYCKERIIFLLILLVLSFSIIISGCGIIQKKSDEVPTEQNAPEIEEQETEENAEDTRETILYYQDNSGYLVPVMRRIKWEEGIARAALSKLIDSPEQQQEILGMGLKPILPANTQIHGISIENGLAKVDFNSAAMEHPDAISENNMVQGVVMTLAEFPTIDKVQFMFDGKIIDTLQYGTKVGTPIEPGNINLELSHDSSGSGAEVTVFFHNTSSSNYEYLVPVTRITSNSIATIETAMEELIRGPKAEGSLRLDIPANTKLLGVQMDEGITYINFSEEFNQLKESASQDIVLRAITMTAKGYPEVEIVKILVDGKEFESDALLATPVFANEY